VGNTHLVENHFVKKLEYGKKNKLLITLPMVFIPMSTKPQGMWGAPEVLAD
jgi:hypothetical protein